MAAGAYDFDSMSPIRDEPGPRRYNMTAPLVSPSHGKGGGGPSYGQPYSSGLSPQSSTATPSSTLSPPRPAREAVSGFVFTPATPTAFEGGGGGGGAAGPGSSWPDGGGGGVTTGGYGYGSGGRAGGTESPYYTLEHQASHSSLRSSPSSVLSNSGASNRSWEGLSTLMMRRDRGEPILGPEDGSEVEDMFTLDGMDAVQRERMYDWLISHGVDFTPGRTNPNDWYGVLWVPSPQSWRPRRGSTGSLSPNGSGGGGASGGGSVDGSVTSNTSLSTEKSSVSFVPKNKIYRRTVDTIVSRYASFCAPLQDSLETLCARKRSHKWLVKLIDEIYDARYLYETAVAGTVSLLPFPSFVLIYLGKKFGLDSLVEQNAWDLVFCTEVSRQDVCEVEVFAKFLEEVYDWEDLQFFLFARNVAVTALNLNPAQKNKLFSVSLSLRTCEDLSRSVFRSEAMHDTFLRCINAFLAGKGKKKNERPLIDLIEFLYLMLIQFNSTRTKGSGANRQGSQGDNRSGQPSGRDSSDSGGAGGGEGGAGGGGGGAGGQVITDAFIASVRVASNETLKEFVEVLSSLPPSVAANISSTLEGDLHTKVAEVLTVLLENVDQPQRESEKDSYRGALTAQLQSLVDMQLRDDGGVHKAQLSFARSLLKSPMIRQYLHERLAALLAEHRGRRGAEGSPSPSK